MLNIEKIEQYLQKKGHSIYITEQGCQYVSKIQEILKKGRRINKDRKEEPLPEADFVLIEGTSVNASSTKCGDNYYIFINKGIIEEQREYLQRYDWKSFLDEEEIEQYLDSIIEYGFYFIAMHEYAHILCQHAVAADAEENITKESEADMFSMSFLVKYIGYIQPDENLIEEEEKMFLAVYFLLENMGKQDYRELYNDRLMENYYSPDKVQKRDHPLVAQRIFYLYDMLNIVVVTNEVKKLPLKDRVIEKLCKIKGLNNIKKSIDNINYNLVEDSICNIKELVNSKGEYINVIWNFYQKG